MAEPSEPASLELRIAFHNAVSRFHDWTADVAEPKVQFRGRFCPISEICQEVANRSNPLPRTILSILYKETRAGDDRLTLARRSFKIFDAILEALTLLLVEIAPMRPPPHSCILKMRQHSLSVLAGIDYS
jgi:hypothetical protein